MTRTAKKINFIRKRREELGMAQGELASKTGLTQGAISRYESDSTVNMSYKKMVAIAKALRVPVIELAENLLHQKLGAYAPATAASNEFTETGAEANGLLEQLHSNFQSVIALLTAIADRLKQ